MMGRTTWSWFQTAAVLVAAASPAAGQQRSPVIEALGGWAGFLDDATIHHAVIGGSVRVSLTPRLSVGPEVVYLIGPNTARELYVTGQVFIDLTDGAAA
jgi:hypothetical protein